jgi:hypothetical protein
MFYDDRTQTRDLSWFCHTFKDMPKNDATMILTVLTGSGV